MGTRPVSDEALIERGSYYPIAEADDLTRRILPQFNPDRQDRAQAWAEWQELCGDHILMRFVRGHNNTREADEDIVQEAVLTAYLGVESQRYQPRENVPFTAYVIGIARNKIREARRRERHLTDLDETEEEVGPRPVSVLQRQPERAIERREQLQLLHSGVSRLPEARRQVIERYLAGASTNEIAGQMAISEDLVRQHKCRGLRALQRDLQAVPVGQGSYA